MNWLIVIVFVILNYGMSNMIVYSNGPFHCFLHFRNLMGKISKQFEELFSCMICYPTWNAMMLSVVGLIIGVSFTPFSLIFAGHYPLLTILFDGCFGSGSTWFIHNIEEYFERSNVHYVDEDVENQIEINDDVDGRVERD